MNLVANSDNIQGIGDFIGYFCVGAIAGGLSSVVGTVTFGSGGFIGGALSGLASGAVYGAIAGGGNSFVKYGNFSHFLDDMYEEAWKGALYGAAIGGISGGLSALVDGRNFWNGHEKMVSLTIGEIEPALPTTKAIAPKQNIDKETILEIEASPVPKYELDGNFEIRNAEYIPEGNQIGRPKIKGYANRKWPTEKYHAFPREMDKKIVDGGLQLYHNGNTGFIYPGSVDGKIGFYNITIDANNIVKHRFFYPYDKRNSIWVGTMSDKLYFFK